MLFFFCVKIGHSDQGRNLYKTVLNIKFSIVLSFRCLVRDGQLVSLYFLSH